VTPEDQLRTQQARRTVLHVPASTIPTPPEGVVEGVAMRMRGGPCDGRTGEYIGAYPQHLDVNLGSFGIWRYLMTREFVDITDFRPGTFEERTRSGRIYEWNGRDPDGHKI
jgi:hypothetical protein